MVSKPKGYGPEHIYATGLSPKSLMIVCRLSIHIGRCRCGCRVEEDRAGELVLGVDMMMVHCYKCDA